MNENSLTYDEMTRAVEKLVTSFLELARPDGGKPTPDQLSLQLLARGSFLLWNVLTHGSKRDEHREIWERLNQLTAVDAEPEAARRWIN
jgi:hypothetical protein